MLIRFAMLVLCVLVAMSGVAAQAPAGAVPHLDGAWRARVIASDEARVDGVTVRYWTFESPLPRVRLAALARAEVGPRSWAPVASGDAESGALLYSRRIGAWHETLQLRETAAGSTLGVASRIDLAQRPADRRALVPRAVPLPGGLQVRRVIDTTRPDGATSLLLLDSPWPPGRASVELARSVQAAGWQPIHSHERRCAGACARSFVLGGRTLTWTMRGTRRGSSIVMVHVDAHRERSGEQRQ